MTTSKEYHLNTGKLSLTFKNEHYRFDSICSLAERINPKRQFMFVSKVIGRYTPTMFSTLNDVSRSLVNQINGTDLEGDDNNVTLLSLAETGLGLGYLVHNHLSEIYQNVLRIQTTRRTLSAPILAEFVEPHSHFPNHYIYKSFDQSINTHLEQTNTLIIVDDEITTGNTIKNLVGSLKDKLPCLRKVIVLSLTDWSSALTLPDLELKTYSLVKGTYTWEQDNDVPVPHLPYKRPEESSSISVKNDHFRLPTFESLSDVVLKTHKLIRYNTSDIQIYYDELIYASLLNCLYKYKYTGKDSVLLSVSSSPLKLNNIIKTKLVLPNLYDSTMESYLYNFDDLLNKGFSSVCLSIEEAPQSSLISSLVAWNNVNVFKLL